MSESVITNVAGDWISNYGPFTGRAPWGRVIHCLQAQARAGLAWSLSERGGWLDNENLGPHRVTDPTNVVSVLPTTLKGGHVGSPGNSLLVGYEVTGMAEWTEEEWMDGGPRQAALLLNAKIIAEDYVRDGWTEEEIRYLSGQQIRDNVNGTALVRGLLTHNDVSEFIGGTSHWDPGLGFPFAWFLAQIKAWFRHLTGKPGTTPPPTPAPPSPLGDNVNRILFIADNGGTGEANLDDRTWFGHSPESLRIRKAVFAAAGNPLKTYPTKMGSPADTRAYFGKQVSRPNA